MTARTILGISAYFHDSAAALIRDGKIIAAASEERFTRIKGDPSFPTHAVAYCLAEAGIARDQLDAVGFYDKPILKFDRILSTYFSIAPRGFKQFLKAGPLWVKDKLWTEHNVREELGGYKGKLYFAEHHEFTPPAPSIPRPSRKRRS